MLGQLACGERGWRDKRYCVVVAISDVTATVGVGDVVVVVVVIIEVVVVDGDDGGV